MTKRSARRGVVYVGVIIVCVVLAIGVAAFHRAMRHGRTSAYRSLSGEHAAALAKSGLSLAQVHLNRQLADPDSAVRRKLAAPLAELAASRGAAAFATVDLTAEFPELVAKVVREMPLGLAGVRGLEAKYGVVSVEPLPALSLSGRTLERGNREKCGQIWIECTARIDTGSLGEVTRSLRAVHEFRAKAAPVPVLSDFTLFLEDRPNAGGWGKKSPIEKLAIWNAEPPRSGLAALLDLDGAKARGFVFLGDNERAGSTTGGYRPQLSRELLPSSWGDALDRLELGSLTLAELGPQLASTACWKAPGGANLEKYLEERGMLDGGRLDLGTSVHAQGSLTLPALDTVHRGGLLIAREITITGPIPAPYRGALVLVATEGSIRVPAGVPVHASLVALKGSVVLSGAPDIRGSIAAVKLDPQGLSDGAKLSYDKRLKDRPFGEGPAETMIIDFARKPVLVE